MTHDLVPPTVKTADLERSCSSRHGPGCLREARALADQLAKEHGVDPERIYRSALHLAQSVTDWNQEPARYRCPVCFDKAWQIVHADDLGGTAAVPCSACEPGLKVAAGVWLDVVKPHGRKGRFDDPEGKSRFEQHFRHLPTQRGKILAFMDYLERREGSGKKTWD